jgi:hypothetical protein
LLVSSVAEIRFDDVLPELGERSEDLLEGLIAAM